MTRRKSKKRKATKRKKNYSNTARRKRAAARARKQRASINKKRKAHGKKRRKHVGKKRRRVYVSAAWRKLSKAEKRRRGHAIVEQTFGMPLRGRGRDMFMPLEDRLRASGFEVVNRCPVCGEDMEGRKTHMIIKGGVIVGYTCKPNPGSR